jgi:FlaA1/EpsC-like NDP-sugar epimerase
LYFLINEVIPKNPDDEAERMILNCLSQDDFVGIFSRLKEKDSYMDMLNIIVENQNKTLSMKRWVIDTTQLKGSLRIAVYGFGDVGKDIVNQLSRIHDYEIVAIYDSNYKKDTRLSDPKEITVCQFDYVIVTPVNAEVYSLIKKNVIEMGIPEKKIIIAKDILQGVEKDEN